MKTKLILILGGMLLLSQAAMAQTTVYSVSAAVPAGSGVSIAVNSVTGTVYTPVAGTTLTYSSLQYNSATSVYLAPNSYTFDVTVNGAGAPNTQVTYTAGSVPSGATSTLGGNSSIAFDKEVYTSSSTPPAQTAVGSPAVLSSIAGGTTVPYTSVAPGWLRIYMGLCTGNQNSASGTVDPAGCKPFTSADTVGSYTGSLTISATVN